MFFIRFRTDKNWTENKNERPTSL